ncbi:MAG: hypothetical protein ABIY52_17180, partial [Gemmatimonadaceae bacterium]
TPLANGWAYIPATAASIVVSEAGKTRTYPAAPWYATLTRVIGDAQGRRVIYTGWNRTTGDSAAASTLLLDNGSHEHIMTAFGEGVGLSRLSDGVLIKSYPTQESVALIKVPSGGAIQKLGTIPRPISAITASGDMKRATIDERDYRADAWMSKVIVP